MDTSKGEQRTMGPKVGQNRWTFENGVEDMLTSSAKHFCMECKASNSCGPQEADEMQGTPDKPYAFKCLARRCGAVFAKT